MSAPDIKTKWIAVDFDSTITLSGAEFPEIGRCNPEAIPTLLQLKQLGFKLMLWTCRADESLKAAVEWCAVRGLHFDAINEYPEQKEWSNSPKAYADYYIDDKSVGITLKSFKLDDGYQIGIDWKNIRRYFNLIKTEPSLDNNVIVLDEYEVLSQSK